MLYNTWQPLIDGNAETMTSLREKYYDYSYNTTSEAWFYDGVHFNETGARFIKDTILDLL